MHRFFVPPALLNTPRVRLEGDVAQQIRRVLRMRPGDHFCLLDGLGYEYSVVLTEFGKDEVWADVLDKTQVQTEPQHKVSMYLSLLNKADKFEWALQKCTELGAARFIPVVAERSVTGALKAMRRERWERIIREAAEQSNRGLLPALDEPVSIKDALSTEARLIARKSEAEERHVTIMPELGGAETITGAVRSQEQTDTASIFIGPEGGFTPAEVTLAGEAGVAIVSLGARILRAETAAIASLTVVMYELGEIGKSPTPNT